MLKAPLSLLQNGCRAVDGVAIQYFYFSQFDRRLRNAPNLETKAKYPHVREWEMELSDYHVWMQ